MTKLDEYTERFRGSEVAGILETYREIERVYNETAAVMGGRVEVKPESASSADVTLTFSPRSTAQYEVGG